MALEDFHAEEPALAEKNHSMMDNHWDQADLQDPCTGYAEGTWVGHSKDNFHTVAAFL